MKSSQKSPLTSLRTTWGDLLYRSAIFIPGFTKLSSSLKRGMEVSKVKGKQFPDPKLFHVYLVFADTEFLIKWACG